MSNPFRYERPPVLQSVCAYGSETLVPNNDLCRLSYYLKCCVVGCGINIGVDGALLDYMNAHQLSVEQQEKILVFAFSDLSLMNLMNRAFILDDQHMLLPQGTLNTFFEFKTASTFFSVDSCLTISTGEQVYMHKVMLCTLKWVREYFIEPFIRYQLGSPILEVHATAVEEEDEVSYAVGGNDYTRQGLIITPLLNHRGEGGGFLRTCCGCLGVVRVNESPLYRCTQCPVAEFCQDCYFAARHDQTHVFERLCRNSTESLSVSAKKIENEDSTCLPDVPVAVAIPVDEPAPIIGRGACEPVARAVSDWKQASSGVQERTRTRRRMKRRRSSCSSYSNEDQENDRSQHLKTIRRYEREDDTVARSHLDFS